MSAIIIIILFLSMPILVISHLAVMEKRRRWRVRKNLESAIHQVASENGIVILDSEYFLNRAIGIDRENRKLLFAICHEDGIRESCADIDNLAYCRVSKTFDESSNQIKEVFLEMKSKVSGEITRVTFFDRGEDNLLAISLLIRKAEYWENKIEQAGTAMAFNQSLEFVL